MAAFSSQVNFCTLVQSCLKCSQTGFLRGTMCYVRSCTIDGCDNSVLTYFSLKNNTWRHDPYANTSLSLAIAPTHARQPTAIDVVKTRIQIDPALAHRSLLAGGRLIVAKEGPAALLTGFGPTAVGYFVQGGGKFAGYEFWKKRFVTVAGDKETAVKYRTAIYLGAASVGESVSCPEIVENRPR
jgi:Mitochondrial carrier protein